MTDRKPLLCLDFDGVLHSYTAPWAGADRVPDPPVPGAMHAIQTYAEQFRVAVYSSRTGQPNSLYAMRAWLHVHLVAEFGAEEGDRLLHLVEWPHAKPPATVTIDDRAVQFTGEWPSVESLAAFKPWNKLTEDERLEADGDLAAGLSEAIRDVLQVGRNELEMCNATSCRDVVAGLAARGYRIVRI